MKVSMDVINTINIVYNHSIRPVERPNQPLTIMSDTERMVHELGTLLDVLLQADDNARKR
jgi:hypothetical protein